MLLGYNTNGLAHHRLIDAIDLLAETGYQCVGVTLDHGSLNPFDHPAVLRPQLTQVKQRLKQHSMSCVVETGARFLLNPRIKHEPTLMTADAAGRQRRVAFLCRAIDIAVELEAGCVSLWSGILHSAGQAAADGAGRQTAHEAAMMRLVDGLSQVLDYAGRKNAVIAFEPEPGMFIDTMESFDQLQLQLDSPALRLTIDAGHLHCLGETPVEDYLRRYADKLVNVHLEDMRAGVHEHLMFGDGEMNFPPIIAALRECGYAGGVYVELSRHSHQAPAAVRRAYETLWPLFEQT